jgi:predicted RNase H-like HicB family nuclease
MKTYIALVHKEEGSAYGIEFPDVPGCFSAADSEDQIISNACEALALHLEGEDLPEARSIEDISLLQDVAAALKDGAALIFVPLVSYEGRVAKANITMDAGLLQAVDATAKGRGITRSAYLADLARNDIYAK